VRTSNLKQQAAAHELGHALVWQSLGLRVCELRVDDHGNGWADARFDQHDPDDLYWHVLGVAAGPEADRLWCDRHRGVWVESESFKSDWSSLRRWLSNPRLREYTGWQISEEARRLVDELWSDVERLAPRLADRGSLSL
jgi:hypothetical protein